MPCFSRCTRVTDVRVNRDVWVFHIPSRTSDAQSTRRSRPMCSTNCRVRRKLAWQLPAESALAFPPVASPSACPLPRTASGKPARQSRAEGPRAGRGPCDTPEQGRAFPALHAAARPFAVGRRRERISLRTGTKLQTLSGPDDSTRSRGSQLPTRTTGRNHSASCPAGSRAGRGESLDEDAGCHLPVGEDRRAPRGGDEATSRHGRWRQRLFL